jgi:hypothetical protein
MTIQCVDSIHQDEFGVVYVTAVVENVVPTYSQTLYDPPEYGAAVCEASFELDEDEVLPDNEHELIQLLENLDLEWAVVDNSDYDY